MKTTGYILNGVYYEGGKTPVDFKDDSTPTEKSHDHDRQREEHRRDFLQPYTQDGKPNQEFIEQYPKEAQEYGFN